GPADGRMAGSSRAAAHRPEGQAMRQRLPLLVLMLLLGVTLAGLSGRPVGPRPGDEAPRWVGQPLDERLFRHDQPLIRRLVEWDGRLVVQVVRWDARRGAPAERVYALDTARGV